MLRFIQWLCPLAILFVGCTPPPTEQVSQPFDAKYIERGRTLVSGLAACGFCHGDKSEPYSILSGGRAQTDKYGSITAPNITPSEQGIGNWSPKDIIVALRTSTNPEEQKLSSEIHRGYEWMSDEDALSIVAYLRGVAPSSKEVERRSVGFVDRNTTGFFESKHAVKGYVPEIPRRFKQEYGKYLADHVARCSSCHNSPGSVIAEEEYLAGGKVIEIDGEAKRAPGISGSIVGGIGGWSEEEIKNYLMTGETPEGRISDTKYCPVEFFRMADPADLDALASYLKNSNPIT